MPLCRLRAASPRALCMRTSLIPPLTLEAEMRGKMVRLGCMSDNCGCAEWGADHAALQKAEHRTTRLAQSKGYNAN